MIDGHLWRWCGRMIRRIAVAHGVAYFSSRFTLFCWDVRAMLAWNGYDCRMACDRQQQLRQVAITLLQRLDSLSKEQLDALQKADYKRLIRLDKQLEKLFGKKQRAFGALMNHCREHGCSFDATLLPDE
jgi:hypothetical protein